MELTSNDAWGGPLEGFVMSDSGTTSPIEPHYSPSDHLASVLPTAPSESSSVNL